MKKKKKLEISEPSRAPDNRITFAGIMVLVALVSTLFYGVVGEDKFLLLSPLVIIGYACLSLWMARSAASPGMPAVAPPGFYLLLVFTVFGVGLAAVSSIPYEAKIRMLLIGLFAGAYYLWGNSLILFRRSRVVLGWVMLFALLASFYGLVNHFKQPDQVLWTTRYAPYEGRLASTYICPNHFAHLLQMLLPFCFVLIFIPKAGMLLRIFAGYCIVVFIPTITLTESRAGMLGAIAALGVTTCLLALRRSRRLFLLIVIAVPLLSSFLLVGAWNYSDMFKRRMTPVVDFLVQAKEDGFANTQTTDFRPLTWLDSIDMVKAEPATGFGPGSYRYAFPEFRKRCSAVRVVTGHPHNEYLEVASEYGLIGFGLLALAWCYGLIRLLVFSLRTEHQHHAYMAMAFLGAAAGTLLHSFFDFQMHVFQNALIFGLLAAIAAGPICGRRQEAILKKEHKPHRPLRFILAVISIAGLLAALQGFSSAFVRATADRLAEAKQTEKATRYYEQAIQLDASNWRAYKGLGVVHFKDRYYELEPEAKRAKAAVERDVFEQAYRRNPKDAELVVGYGRATLFTGNTEAGLDLLQQAVRLRPFNDNYWWELGVAQRKAGHYEGALETFRHAKTIKNSPYIMKNIQWLEQKLTPPVAGDEDENEEPVVPEPVSDPAEPGLDELFKLMKDA